jgi:hypothetical protein
MPGPPPDIGPWTSAVFFLLLLWLVLFGPGPASLDCSRALAGVGRKPEDVILKAVVSPSA